jgi:hypothetical protein
MRRPYQTTRRPSLTVRGWTVTLHHLHPSETDDIVTDGNIQSTMAAQAYIARLGERGIDYVFANAGTDFAPIVEALAHATGGNAPRFITVPHENVAMAMAHGYYRIAGKPAAVMVHVTVGTANAINGVINASRDNVPVLLAAGTNIAEAVQKAKKWAASVEVADNSWLQVLLDGCSVASLEPGTF